MGKQKNKKQKGIVEKVKIDTRKKKVKQHLKNKKGNHSDRMGSQQAPADHKNNRWMEIL